MAKPIYWSDEMFRFWGFDPGQGAPDFETACRRVDPDLKADIHWNNHLRH
jgi:hypothetical protein